MVVAATGGAGEELLPAEVVTAELATAEVATAADADVDVGAVMLPTATDGLLAAGLLVVGAAAAPVVADP